MTRIKGIYKSTAPTVVDGQEEEIQLDNKGNVKQTLATALDKTNDSVTNYPVARNLRVVSKTTAVTIGGGAANDTVLVGLVITAALTGTCAVTGFADSDGTAQTITLPAATTAGFKDFGNCLNSAGALTVTCSNASDDNLVSVIYRAA